MAVTIQLATVDDLPEIVPLVRAYHAFEGINMAEAFRRKPVSCLLSDPSLGGIWHVRSDNESAGYIALTFGYSIEFGGKDAFIDEFYIRPEFRGRGLGTHTLKLIQQEARSHNICAIHLEVAHDNLRAQQLYAQAQFHPRPKYILMSANLTP